MIESESRTEPRQQSPSFALGNGQRFGLLLGGLIILVLSATWIASLEKSLPDIRTPRDLTSSSPLPGHSLMMPGTLEIQDVDAELEGDWVTQEIGESDWLATDLQGSRLSAAFYGTDVYVLARMGPDASRAYVRVNQQPVEHLNSDELGSFVNLWSSQTSDQPVRLARNLAHGEHLVEIIADGEGELAISGFEVSATTPFPWAFVFAYAGVISGIFVLIRYILYSFNLRSSTIIARRSPVRSRVRRDRDVDADRSE
jgi:hypothetical protein